MVEGHIVEGFLGEHGRSNQVYKCIAVKLNVVKKSFGNLDSDSRGGHYNYSEKDHKFRLYFNYPPLIKEIIMLERAPAYYYVAILSQKACLGPWNSIIEVSAQPRYVKIKQI